jgi:hypothetical protein
LHLIVVNFVIAVISLSPYIYGGFAGAGFRNPRSAKTNASAANLEALSTPTV